METSSSSSTRSTTWARPKSGCPSKKRSPARRAEVRHGRHLDCIGFRHHDAFMRTTLTLDADVVKLLEEEVHRARKPFKQVVNDAIRRGLSPRSASRPTRRYKVEPFATTLAP